MEYLDLMEETCGKAERNTKKFISEEETQTPAAIWALFLLESHYEGVGGCARDLLSSRDWTVSKPPHPPRQKCSCTQCHHSSHMSLDNPVAWQSLPFSTGRNNIL